MTLKLQGAFAIRTLFERKGMKYGHMAWSAPEGKQAKKVLTKNRYGVPRLPQKVVNVNDFKK